ncbi:MAG: AlpA family phage regulatory protein [Marinobacter sp.]|nr:AlpA family phage regulatory protein [Marinobacter sp.]
MLKTLLPRRLLGGTSVGWIDSEIHEWLQEKQVERDMRHGPSRGWGL